ncbi:MAG TPA: DUF1488 family protein [Usitatibacter sp.]|jgi:hypothetical protein|nr:DUF1488 family protein [Usitatibacter sp.]
MEVSQDARSASDKNGKAMDVRFTDVHGPLGQGVAFHASVDGSNVICIVTGAALNAVAPGIGAPLEQYRHRIDLLRDVADVLILAGRAKAGYFTIDAEDVRSSG